MIWVSNHLLGCVWYANSAAIIWSTVSDAYIEINVFVPHPAGILAFRNYAFAFRGRLEATVLGSSINASNEMFAKIASKVISDKFVSSIFDVSDLLGKLPEQDVSDVLLGDLALPGEGAIYVSFFLLAESNQDCAYSSYLGDENGMVIQAKTGGSSAARLVRENNFPLVNWVGRGIPNVARLRVTERDDVAAFKI